MQVKGSKEVEYKYIGYFPTVAATKILRMIDDYSKSDKAYEDVTVVRLKGFRGKKLEKSSKLVFPYLTIEDHVKKTMSIDYDFVKHAILDIPATLKAIGDEGIGELVTTQIAIAFPKEWIYKGGKGKLTVSFVIHHIREDDSRMAIVKETSGDEIRDYRFKRSCLELVALQDMPIWASGSKKGYDVAHNLKDVIRPVMRWIDLDSKLGRWAQFQKTKGKDVWVLVTDKSIGE